MTKTEFAKLRRALDRSDRELNAAIARHEKRIWIADRRLEYARRAHKKISDAYFVAAVKEGMMADRW